MFQYNVADNALCSTHYCFFGIPREIIQKSHTVHVQRHIRPWRELMYSGVLERQDLCFVCQYFAITLLSSVNNKRRKKLFVCLSSCKAAENWDITSVVCSTYRSSEDIPSIFTRNMCKTLPKELVSTHDDSCIVLVHVIPYSLKGEKKMI